MSYVADERIDEFAKAFVAYLRRILVESKKTEKQEKNGNAKKPTRR